MKRQADRGTTPARGEWSSLRTTAGVSGAWDPQRQGRDQGEPRGPGLRP